MSVLIFPEAPYYHNPYQSSRIICCSYRVHYWPLGEMHFLSEPQTMPRSNIFVGLNKMTMQSLSVNVRVIIPSNYMTEFLFLFINFIFY